MRRSNRKTRHDREGRLNIDAKTAIKLTGQSYFSIVQTNGRSLRAFAATGAALRHGERT